MFCRCFLSGHNCHHSPLLLWALGDEGQLHDLVGWGGIGAAWGAGGRKAVPWSDWGPWATAQPPGPHVAAALTSRVRLLPDTLWLCEGGSE